MFLLILTSYKGILNNKRFKFSKVIAWQVEPVNDFVYIYNLKKSNFLTLEDLSKDIWLMIKEKKNILEITKQITNEYEVDFDIAKNDVIELINNLLIEGVIEYDE